MIALWAALFSAPVVGQCGGLVDLSAQIAASGQTPIWAGVDQDGDVLQLWGGATGWVMLLARGPDACVISAGDDYTGRGYPA